MSPTNESTPVSSELPAPVFTIDATCRYLTFNSAHARAVEALYGQSIEVGHSILDYIGTREDREAATKLFERVLGGETFSVGSWRGHGAERSHFCVTYRPSRSDDGAVVGATVVAMETTQDALVHERATRAALAIVDGLGVSGYALDAAFHFISLSTAFRGVYEATFGVPPVLGGSFFDGVSDSAEAASIEAEFQRVLAGETITSTAWRGPEGNRRKWAVSRMPLVVEGRVEGIVSFGIDTTEDALLEEATRTAQAFAAEASAGRSAAVATLRAALDSMTDAVFISDADGTFVEFNEAFATFHGFASKDECPTTLAEYSEFLEVFTADGQPAPLDDWAVPRALRGETGLAVEYGVRRKDTGEEWVGSYSFAPVRDEEQSIVGTVVVVRDITSTKRRSAYGGLDREVLSIFNRPDDLRVSIEKVVSAIKASTGADAVGIRLQDGEDYPYFAQVGFSESHIASENSLLMRGADNEVCRDAEGTAILECSCGLVLSGRPHPGLSSGGSLWSADAQATVDALGDEDTRINPRNLCVLEGYSSIAIVPILHAEKAIGVVHVAHRRRNALDLETVAMLEAVVRHIGEALARKYGERALLETNARLENVLKSVVTSMGKVIEARDPYTKGHEQGVAQISRQLAEEMGWPPHEVDRIEVAALVHDVGKLAVPTEILTKPGKLSTAEFALIKGHSQAGYTILRDIEFDWPLADSVLQHHERMDGSGYPSGLRGDEILPAARVLMVADVVEAMAAHRPYRPALGLEAAVAEIAQHPDRFDPEVVAALMRLYEAGRVRIQSFAG